MEYKEWRYEDKSEWGPGPWQSEPDRVQWRDEITSLPCLIRRGASGALCGYVGIGPNHPYYSSRGTSILDDLLNVHGGITFFSTCGGDELGFCPIFSEDQEETTRWVGFDCAHADDLIPGYSCSNGTYRDIDYVSAEVQRLAVQLRAVAGTTT